MEPRRERIKAVVKTRKTDNKMKPCYIYGIRQERASRQELKHWVLRSLSSSDSTPSRGSEVNGDNISSHSTVMGLVVPTWERKLKFVTFELNSSYSWLY